MTWRHHDLVVRVLDLQQRATEFKLFTLTTRTLYIFKDYGAFNYTVYNVVGHMYLYKKRCASRDLTK